jgi:uncharacterized LabA/DUF88 family protein
MSNTLDAKNMAQETGHEIALFIDVQQLSNGIRVQSILDSLQGRGTISYLQACAEYTHVNVCLKKELALLDFDMVEVPEVTASGKNGVDMKISLNIMKLLDAGTSIDTIAIVAGDSDYSHIAREIRQSGRHVIMFSHDKKASSLIRDNWNIENVSLESLQEVQNHALETVNSTLPPSHGKKVVCITNDKGELEIAQVRRVCRHGVPDRAGGAVVPARPPKRCHQGPAGGVGGGAEPSRDPNTPPHSRAPDGRRIGHRCFVMKVSWFFLLIYVHAVVNRIF